MLIRDLPDDVVAAIDAIAQKLGLSRAEYVRRQLISDARRSTEPVTVEDFRHLSEILVDLGDPEVMRGAWR
ncbi:MAG TPA: ribbon-helix-helix protein, CopG family [Galbitalea sp.]